MPSAHAYATIADDPPQQAAERAYALRGMILRTHALAGQGHLGSSLSIVEILATLLSLGLETRGWADGSPRGDRIVLSKGHAALAFYCALAQEGIIPSSLLSAFGSNGGVLEPHPNERLLPAIQASTGSLGQGLSIGLGLAYGSRLSGHDERCFVILGDGELNEGQCWEAAIAAPRLRLGNLTAIVDANEFQQDGRMEEIMPVRRLADAWTALGWEVAEVDGHDCASLATALTATRSGPADRPKLVVARTIKGRGVPFLEGTVGSHFPPPLDNAEIALVERLTQPAAHHG